ncbi:MAG TPA: AIR synthase-related protein, partial [Candidatus Limnocylindrales bacterium]|nr:AIR synthase-related protein [Candidatus Limnocylindrales bacterium]
MTVAERPIEPLHRRLGVTDEELESIRDRLAGRDPNELELAMFSVMWSEHCSYKSSKPLLRTLPTAGEGVVAGPGENAGVISIGGGLAVAFKIESHNHPSAVEPYQGAATGVGGILRDIFTMGARPIAVLDALRFGDPASSRTRLLVDGVVRGVGGYGNCVGVPTVGGELVFDPSYQGNPLVNVMAIGLLEERRLTLASAPGPGNLVVLFGSATGRDGIGGASVLASATFTHDETSSPWLAGASPRSSGRPDDGTQSKRPSVQVGDPFAEKLLIEASLELIERGLVEGLQDLGAGGITCATSETADRAGTGILVDLDAIPRREPGLAPFEVMISESQERMCAAVRPDRWPAVREVCERWGLPVAIIGRVTDDGDIAVVEGGVDGDGRRLPGARELARIPAAALTSDAIVHDRIALAPTHRRDAPAPGAPAAVSDNLPERGMDPGAVLLALIGSPNLASPRIVYEQYDSTVGADTVVGPGHGAAVLRVKGTTKALVASTDANHAVGLLDPWL